MMTERRINVLFISSWFPSRVTPTKSRFVPKHAAAISLYANITVLHVCFDKNLKLQQFEIVEEKRENVNVIYVYVRKTTNIVNKVRLYLKAYRKGFDFAITKMGMIDIVHANVIFPVGLVFLFIKQYRKKRFVITEHWSGYLPESNTKISLIRKYIIKAIARRSSYLLPVSDSLKNAMLSHGIKGKYCVIPDVVDTSVFTPVKMKEKNEVKRILHISSLQDKAKNISGIIRVIKKLSLMRDDFILDIYSNGDQNPFISLADDLKLLNKYVFFHNGKKADEIAAIMQHSDLLVQFSNYESFSCVIMEALSCGLPVVATEVGDIPKHISSESGMLVKPGDEAALLFALNQNA